MQIRRKTGDRQRTDGDQQIDDKLGPFDTRYASDPSARLRLSRLYLTASRSRYWNDSFALEAQIEEFLQQGKQLAKPVSTLSSLAALADTLR